MKGPCIGPNAIPSLSITGERRSVPDDDLSLGLSLIWEVNPAAFANFGSTDWRPGRTCHDAIFPPLDG